MKIFILIFLSVIHVSLAQDPGSDARCESDRQKFCETEQWAHEVRYCILQNKSRLSKDCKEVVDENNKKYSPIIKICRHQIHKICDKGFKHNAEGCLKVNRDQFKDDCGKAVRALK